MDTLQTFNNVVFGSVRALLIDGEPWCVGKDVATALGYKNTKDALSVHVDSEDKQIIQRSYFPTFENHLPKQVFHVNFVPADIPNRGLTIINESGLYSLIFGSKLESAKRFKHWVTSEVLPTLRKTGVYTMSGAETAEQRDVYIKTATIVASCKNERLPIVMKLLEQAGFEIPHIMDIKTEIVEGSGRDMTGETARAINHAIDEYGFSIRRIERLTGISATELSRIRKRVSNPKKARMRIICNAIRSEIEKIENK